jgi:hypothetical protein
MVKKACVLLFSGLLVITLSGCIALLAGAAGGAGTAAWLSGKLSQEVNAPFNQSINATKSALRSLQLEVAKETTEANTAQIVSKYSDGKTIWIDIHRITEHSSKIDVRVGAVSTDKEAADKILKRIIRFL